MIGWGYSDALDEVWRSSRVAWLRVRIGSAMSGWWFQMALTAWAGWGARSWLMNRAISQQPPGIRRHASTDRLEIEGNG
jgi:hypothetical protein